MSLVICSNQDSDSTTSTTQQSIYKPYSFRNGLSSTYTIPKNGQVALQSCKYNLDGTIPLSGSDQVLYQYFGKDSISESEDPANQKFDINLNSASVPIRTQIFKGRKDTIEEVSAVQLADELQVAMNDSVMHPNLRDLVSVDVKRDGTSGEFTGYDIEYDQYVGEGVSKLPADDEVIDQMDGSVLTSDGKYDNFEYEGGDFTGYAQKEGSGNPVPGVPQKPVVGVLASNPISAFGGELVVDITDPNDNDLEWGVGLSRYVNHTRNFTGTPHMRMPKYAVPSTLYGATQPSDFFFFDYIVCRKGDKLKVYHMACDSGVRTTRGDVILSRELVYGSEEVSYNYDLKDNANAYAKVKFMVMGQRIEIYMLEDDDSEHLLYTYNPEVESNSNQLSCISQAKWNLYPLLYLPINLPRATALYVQSFIGCQNEIQTLKQRLDDGIPQTVSWYNSIEGSTNEGLASSLENRPWNDAVLLGELWETYMIWATVEDPSTPINLENYLIMKPSRTFSPSRGANTQSLLGFTATPNNNYVPDGLLRTFSSDVVPQLLASRSMFVRLENMTQNSLNSRVGNRSSIIAHLPRFDGQVETGRIYHEPKNLIFLDLNNSQPMRVSSFDISFVYSNEQFVQSLTGQSVVCLYFREKPSEKIQQV